MEVSGFFTSSLFSNDEYKSKKKRNSKPIQPTNPSANSNDFLPDGEEMNKEIQTLLQNYEGDTKKKLPNNNNLVNKTKKLPTNQEIYEKYVSFKKHILSQFVEYDHFMDTVILNNEDTDIAKGSTSNGTSITSNTKIENPALASTVNKFNIKSATNNNSANTSINDEHIKRVSPLNLVDTYVVFTDIKTSFKTTKFSDFLKIKTSATSNTRKWYRKYFKYFFIVDGMLQYLDPDHNLPIEVLKDLEDLMIQKATTPSNSSTSSLLDPSQEEDATKPDGEEKTPTPAQQATANNNNRFSHEMFLSGTNLTGYSIFMVSVRKEDFEDFIKSLHQKIIANYGPKSIKPELSLSDIDAVYERLMGSKRPEPLMALKEYKSYNPNW